jgi:hypothetical protein
MALTMVVTVTFGQHNCVSEQPHHPTVGVLFNITTIGVTTVKEGCCGYLQLLVEGCRLAFFVATDMGWPWDMPSELVIAFLCWSVLLSSSTTISMELYF